MPLRERQSAWKATGFHETPWNNSRSPPGSCGYPRMLLEMVLGFESHMGRTLSLFAKIKSHRNQLLKAPSSVGRHNSMRVGEGRNFWSLPAKKMETRTVVGRGEKSLCLVTRI